MADSEMHRQGAHPGSSFISGSKKRALEKVNRAPTENEIKRTEIEDKVKDTGKISFEDALWIKPYMEGLSPAQRASLDASRAALEWMQSMGGVKKLSADLKRFDDRVNTAGQNLCDTVADPKATTELRKESCATLNKVGADLVDMSVEFASEWKTVQRVYRVVVVDPTPAQSA